MFSLDRLVILFAVLSVGALVLLGGRPSFTNASRPPRDILDSGVAVQVARNIEEVDAIMGDSPSPDREVMRVKQFVNVAFIGCYAGFYLLISAALFRRSKTLRWGKPLAVGIASAAVVAATFDVRDMLAILRLVDVDLTHTTQALIDSLRHLSLVKWAFASLAVGLVGGFYLPSRKWTTKVPGIVNIAAAAAGFWGLLDNAMLVWAVGLMAVALLSNAVTLKFLTYEPAA